MKLPSDTAAQALAGIYRDAELVLVKRIGKALRSGALGSARYRAAQLKAVHEQLALLGQTTLPQAHQVLQQAYREGLVIANTAGVTAQFSGIHTEAVSMLADALTSRLGQGLTNIGRQTDDVFRREGLRLSALQLAEGSTRREASAALVDTLTKQGISSFTDKTGREWGLGRYTEMVLRTTSREAASVATKNRLIDGGMDLVTWNASNEPCDVCGQYAGNTYSLTGQTDGYEVLDQLPPAHPNCLCSIAASTSTFEALEAALGV